MTKTFRICLLAVVLALAVMATGCDWMDADCGSDGLGNYGPSLFCGDAPTGYMNNPDGTERPSVYGESQPAQLGHTVIVD
jgi:hypothetical protein